MGEKESTGDGKGDRHSSDCLMASAGDYWSIWEHRLFHSVIQLFSHLVDVPAARIRAIHSYLSMQNHRVALKKHESYGSVWGQESSTRLHTGKNGRFRCVFTLVPKSVQFRGYHIFHFYSATFWLLARIHFNGKTRKPLVENLKKKTSV